MAMAASLCLPPQPLGSRCPAFAPPLSVGSRLRAVLQPPRRQQRRRCLVAASQATSSSSGEFEAAAPSWLRAYRGAVGGGSGSTTFGLGNAGAGKSGAAAFAGSPWHGPASAAAPPVAAGIRGKAAPADAAQETAAAPAAAMEGSRKPWDLANLQKKLQSLGLAGVMAYDMWAILGGVGLFNCLYYTGAFLFFWRVANVPRGQGLAAAASKFAAIMAGVWAGSQVTKAPRAAAALMLAPIVDKWIAWLQQRTPLKTRKAVFFVFLATCISLAFTVFGATVVAWA